MREHVSNWVAYFCSMTYKKFVWKKCVVKRRPQNQNLCWCILKMSSTLDFFSLRFVARGGSRSHNGLLAFPGCVVGFRFVHGWVIVCVGLGQGFTIAKFYLVNIVNIQILVSEGQIPSRTSTWWQLFRTQGGTWAAHSVHLPNQCKPGRVWHLRCINAQRLWGWFSAINVLF